MMTPVQLAGNASAVTTTRQETKSSKEAAIGKKELLQPVYLGCYTDLLRQKRIGIWSNPDEGLSARIDHLTSNGEVFKSEDSIPLTGVPKEVTRETDAEKLIAFFQMTHLLPEKGMEGTCNRVSVHISGKGGVKAAIPFQPGLALGTIVKGDIIDKMEKYATLMAEQEALEEQVRNAEQTIQALETKITSRRTQNSKAPVRADPSKGKGDAETDPLIAIWNQQIDSTKDFLKAIADKIASAGKGEIPLFTSFQQGVVSPVDMGASVVEIQPRAFDSMNFSSTYISMREESEVISDRITQSSSASSFSAGGGWFFASGSVSHARTDAVVRRVNEIRKEGRAEGVLIINAMVTTRNVRTITDLKYDLSKLEQIHGVMGKAEAKELTRYGITNGDDGEKCLYILTEAVLGGSFTALVTFLDESRMKRDVNMVQREESRSTSAQASGGFLFWRANAGGSHASASASRNEDDVLRSIAQTRVNIEFISQGALPQFNRQIIEREIMKHLDLNPSKYELSKKDESDAAELAKGGQVAGMKRVMKMENAQVALLNTYKGLTATKEQQNIHTMESVMGAYENFAEQMTQDKECGVPVGFYYQVLTQSEIKKILEASRRPVEAKPDEKK